LPPKNADTASFNAIRAIPNPVTTGTVKIIYNDPGVSSMEVELSDMNGMIVLRQYNFPSGGLLNLSGLQNGLYILRLIEPNGKVFGRISIIKL
jgi:hypothetical protein